eukprot:TRINITY_DN14073_c0_g1_i3.p2 TRINITY_DN14073_c0_g1~~TRINITY_DN14073_c0_g1_i3.p2  ORF type:complete len:504 (+),score=157.87 TRINITY_DN14073_c0_g1_i3:77-1588(+)
MRKAGGQRVPLPPPLCRVCLWTACGASICALLATLGGGDNTGAPPRFSPVPPKQGGGGAAAPAASPGRTPQPEPPSWAPTAGSPDTTPEFVVPAGELQLVTQGPQGAYSGTAYVFRDACVSYNRDNSVEHTERAIVVLTGAGGQRQCVPCFNPVMTLEWDKEVWPQKAKCGMHWLHKVETPTLGELEQCWDSNEARMREWGQRQSPAKPRRAAVWRPRTVILSYHSFNIGHQLFDSVFALAAVVSGGAEDPPPVLAISHQDPKCPGSTFFCSLLRQHGWLRDDMLLPFDPNDDLVTCFRELVAPRYGIGRVGGAEPDFGALQRMRRAILSAAPAPSPAEAAGGAVGVAVYGRMDSTRRRWLDCEAVADDARRRLNASCRVEHVRSVSALSFAQQAALFRRSKFLILAHGAVAANAVFASPGTSVLEVACQTHSHLATYGGGRLLREWVLSHATALAEQCQPTPADVLAKGPAQTDQGRMDYDFSFSFDDVLRHMHHLSAYLTR